MTHPVVKHLSQYCQKGSAWGETLPLCAVICCVHFHKLHVRGRLNIYQCAALKALPEELEVEGDLNLLNCGAMESETLDWDKLSLDEEFPPIPNSEGTGSPICKPVSFRGNVWGFDELLAHWTLTGKDLSDVSVVPHALSHDLRRVKPATEFIQETLSSYVSATTDTAEEERRQMLVGLLEGKCSLLKGLIAVQGDLNLPIHELCDLQELPDLGSVEGHLTVNDSPSSKASLTVLPERLSVGGNLTLVCCDLLRALPQASRSWASKHLPVCCAQGAA
mmetsp:Transcript_8598/g.15767  ORF Transcript_8598/g.15767 Transcript_8598/m.15767 type:complete len:277 (-) Transcript_8598:88-918(-)